MFIGHYGVGFAGRAARNNQRGPSLGTWFLAVQWLDLVWPIFIVLGVEHVRIAESTGNPFLNLDFTDYPWSHSLLAALVWAVLFAILYRLRTRDAAGAAWLGAGVFSHWALDFITHVPDLPLYPGSATRVGLGLWRSPAATIVVEGAIFLAALAAYLRATRARDRVGRWALAPLVAFLLIVYVASLLGPPPPNATAIGASALLLWLLTPWAYWIDRHRAPGA
jgi:membrane-bound metal-dependent hydrolase YbcI (DUF457 family)